MYPWSTDIIERTRQPVILFIMCHNLQMETTNKVKRNRNSYRQYNIIVSFVAFRTVTRPAAVTVRTVTRPAARITDVNLVIVPGKARPICSSRHRLILKHLLPPLPVEREAHERRKGHGQS